MDIHTIILDNGHGIDTKGKCSPLWDDGTRLYEWEFNRDMVDRIYVKCVNCGMNVIKLVPEITDISLGERCMRANELQDKYGKTIVVSVHANAGGGTGFEIFTSRGKTKADDIATIFIERLQKDFPEIKMRKDWSDGDADKESDFYILKHTKAPAILVENLFMDTRKDCLYLQSEEFKDRLADSYVRALMDCVKNK